MKTKRAWVASFLGLFLLIGCSEEPAPASPTPAAADAASVATAITTPISIEAPPSPVPTPMPVPNTQPVASCLAPATPAPPAKPTAFADIAPALVGYLNAGASPSDTVGVLTTWGNIYLDSATNQMLGGGQTVRVMAGDVPQLALTYFDPTQSDATQPLLRFGEVLVVACVNAQYQIAYRASTDPTLGGVVLGPRLFGDEDVTGDGLGDLSFLTGDCGAETCVGALSVLSVVGAGAGADKLQPNPLINILPTVDEITLAYPTYKFVPAANGSAAKDLHATAGLISGAGVGPQRTTTHIWTFNGAVFTRTAVLAELPTYRIHALHDGDTAFRRKDFAAAEALYQRVVNDTTLQSWDGPAPLQDEAKILAAFAYVRLIQSAAARGDSAAVQTAHDALNALAPLGVGSAGEIYAQLGKSFVDALRASNDYAQACQAAVAFAAANPNTYLTIGPDTFGFNNYDYQPEDMCMAQ